MLFPRAHAWTPLQKWIIASFVILVCAAAAFLIYSYERSHPQRPGLESVDDLGFGFKLVRIDKLYDGYGHSEYLAYHNRYLCQLTPSLSPSISPSGKFAIYLDGLSGKLYLFRRNDERITELTPKFIGVAYPVVWHEDQGTVEAQFEKEHTSMVFSLR